MTYDNGKPFSSLDEQIALLKNRGIKIENLDYAKQVLLNNNYYSIINGYKDPFLKKFNNQVEKPEKFIEGTTFSDIYTFYKFDRDLRNVLLNYLLMFETRLKSIISYEFSKKYPEPYSYLNINNYSDTAENLSDVLKNLKNLSLRLNKGRSERAGKPSVKHYVSAYNHVPIWVLINTLTFGEVQFFYDALDQDLKNKVTKDFSDYYKNHWITQEKIDVGELKSLIIIANFYRNVCAHGERLYNYKLRVRIHKSAFRKYFKSSPIFDNLNAPIDLYSIISLLSIVMNRKEYKGMLHTLKSSIDRCNHQLKVIGMSDVYELMGFPKVDWKGKIQVKGI